MAAPLFGLVPALALGDVASIFVAILLLICLPLTSPGLICHIFIPVFCCEVDEVGCKIFAVVAGTTAYETCLFWLQEAVCQSALTCH